MKITKRRLKRIIREEYTRLKRRGLIKESVSFRLPNGEPTQAENYILDFFVKNTYVQGNIPPELSGDDPDKVNTIGNLASLYFDEGLPVEEAIEACAQDFVHTDDITFLAMSPEDVKHAYSVFDAGGIYDEEL